MLKLMKQYRFYLILLLFLLIPLLSIDTTNRSPRDYRFYDRIALAITTPFEIAIHWTLDTVVGFYENYISLWKTRKENGELIDENRKLVNTILNLRELEQENLRFRNLLQFKETFKVDTVVARMIAKDVSTDFRTIRINRGKSSGIAPNMAVVNAEGVVGRVLRVNEETSDVVTILDPLSAIDAYILRSRVRGIVEGLSDTLCQLKFALRVDDILPGDLLLSSGLGGNFPKGVPVGTVIKVTRKSYGITQKVEVRPSVDFSKVEEVMVVTRADAAPAHMQLFDPAPEASPAPAKGPAKP